MGSGQPPVATRTCTNCGASGAKAYCPDCGQHVVDGRITAGSILSEFFSWVFNVDRGLWLTLRDLLIRPAQVVGEYWAGRRGIYLGPVRFLLVVVLLVSLHELLFPDEFLGVLHTTDGEVKLMVQFLFGLLMPLAALVLLLRYGWRKRTYWEHLVATIYLMGLLLIVSMLIIDPLALLLDLEDGAPPWVFTGFLGAHFVLYPPLYGRAGWRQRLLDGLVLTVIFMALSLGCLLLLATFSPDLEVAM